MDARRWSNILSVARAYRGGHPRSGRGPREAWIEVSARCNLRCRMCAITVDPRYRPGGGRPALLPPELFTRLEPLFPTLQRAHLFGLGEPLLNPHLPDYARRLADAGVDVWTTTNGTLVDRARAETLARAGFSRIGVSIDGATAETYESIRRRGRFADALRGLHALGAARRRHGRPRLALNFVAMASNLRELPQLVELGAESGVEEIFVEMLYEWPHPDLHEHFRRQSPLRLGAERVRELVAAGRRRAEALGIAFSSRLELWDGQAGGEATQADPPPLPFPCCEPWTTMIVSTAGEVRTCCFNDTLLGRLDAQPPAEIWNGEPWAELRRRHAALRAPRSCEGCVSSHRVKRSSFLATEPSTPSLARPDRRGCVDYPGDLELVGDPLIVAGRLPRRRPGADRPPVLPEILLDGHLIAGVRGNGVDDGERFAAVLPVPFVTEGSHRLTVRAPDPDGGEIWGERQVLLGRPGGGEVAGVCRVAFTLDLARYERRPRSYLGGRRLPLALWICGPWGEGWRAVGVVDLTALPPGVHDLELRLRRQPPRRLRLRRLAVEGAFGFGRRRPEPAEPGATAAPSRAPGPASRRPAVLQAAERNG